MTTTTSHLDEQDNRPSPRRGPKANGVLRWAFAGVPAAAMVLGALATPAGATPPRVASEPVNYTVSVDYYTQLCGFPVWFTLAGQLDSKVFTDASGTVVREVDTQPGTRQTFASATRSFSFPFASTLVTDYPDGAYLGAPAVVTGNGLAGKVPGIPADAGTITYQGIVVDFTAQGVPITAFGGVLAMHGHSNDPAAADAAICAALTP